jgi:hypothetical protein
MKNMPAVGYPLVHHENVTCTRPPPERAYAPRGQDETRLGLAGCRPLTWER